MVGRVKILYYGGIYEDGTSEGGTSECGMNEIGTNNVAPYLSLMLCNLSGPFLYNCRK